MARSKKGLRRPSVEVEVENYMDLALRQAAEGGRVRVRKTKVRAFVEPGLTLLSLPSAAIRKLGLRRDRSLTVRTGKGEVECGIYQAVQMTILGRQCIAEVMEIPEDVPPLLGFIPLESLDLVVNPKLNQVTHNPENGGKYTLDLL